MPSETPQDEPTADQTENGSKVETQSESSFLTVGIGASAGGLEAFQAFFRHMDENSGMAFVLISHLSPDHDSLLSELLAKETEMDVLQVQSETQLQPNRVYVIPPNAILTVEGGILRPSPPVQARGHRAPINIFFRSLAEDQAENAVCVVLSGSGSDGSIGLKSIKEFGGLAIAQDDSAKYDSMPRNAVMTGLVDYVLPVEEIPAKLIEYARHRDGLRASTGEDGILTGTADYLQQICSLLRRRLGHDFSNYKQSTLIRRIQRRIQVTQNASAEEYLKYLQSESEEVSLLFKDLLIGVTHFFRDRESFDTLQHRVIASLVENSAANKSIRIWVAGCSSGEEAYSIAMLVSEEMERQNVRAPVQIFATDIDERALEQARHARYPESVAEQVTPERLDRFFSKQDGLYQIAKHLRDMCIFSQHSLISNPPFSRLDLISCRNLLIYFDSSLQKKLIPLFHYALREDGYLFLGSSENLAEHGELFRTADKPHRIFQRRESMIPPQIDFPLVDNSAYRQLSQSSPEPVLNRRMQVTRSIERVILQDYAPACVIINEHNDVVYFFGRTGKYLEPSQGIPSNNLFDLARRGLRIDLRAAIQAAKETQKAAVREKVSIEREERIQSVKLTVRPVKETAIDSDLLMVIFQDVGEPMSFDQAQVDGNEPTGETQVVQQLEDELRVTKDHLRSTIEELETSNEELKSANEELLSMNEELQSSNEELQTSKEEMQSINEELETVNSELRNKVEELDAVNSDIQNLFESTRIATVFLDLNLRIKRFTPAATTLFNFIGTDVGRPLTDISLSLEGLDDIGSEVRSVSQSLVPVEHEVQLQGEAYYKMRIMPYRTIENVIDGTVLTFVDVTDLRSARAQAEQQAQQQEAIAQLGLLALHGNTSEACEHAVTVSCKVLDCDLCSLFIYQEDNPDELLLKHGSDWPDGSIGHTTVSCTASHAGYTLEVKDPVLVEDFTKESRFSQSSVLSELNIISGVSVVVYDGDTPYGVLTNHAEQARQYSAEDVSFLQALANVLSEAVQRERTAKDLARNRRRLDMALNAGDMGTWEQDLVTGLSTWNAKEYELLGLVANEADTPGRELFYRHMYSEDIERVHQGLEDAIARNTEFNDEFRISHTDGTIRWLAAKAKASYDSDGTPLRLTGINYDITKQKQTEAALQAADRRKDDFLATLGHELRNPLNALNSSLTLLSAKKNPKSAEKLYKVAKRQLNQLSRLVDDLLNVSRIAHQKIQILREPLDLTHLLQNVTEDHHELCDEKLLTLYTSLPNTPVWVSGDYERLTQAFSNVLRNAIKFSNPKDRIVLSTTLDPEKVTISISDTGIGIEPVALSRIFTAFSQEDRSLSRSGGLGSGATACKRCHRTPRRQNLGGE